MSPALVMAFVLTALASASVPTEAKAAEDPNLTIRQVVLDIISFTRWPEPRAELQLCVVGQASHAGAFFEGDVHSGPTPVRPQRVAAADDRLGAACDAVYAGTLTSTEREQIGRRIAGRPVLTVGEAGPGCIETTMFCLQIVGNQVAFASNLDAISRSGVRLNPRVLLLGRRPAAAPSAAVPSAR